MHKLQCLEIYLYTMVEKIRPVRNNNNKSLHHGILRIDSTKIINLSTTISRRIPHIQFRKDMEVYVKDTCSQIKTGFQTNLPSIECKETFTRLCY